MLLRILAAFAIAIPIAAAKSTEAAPSEKEVSTRFFGSAEVGVTLSSANSAFQAAANDYNTKEQYGSSLAEVLRGGFEVQFKRLVLDFGGGLMNGTYTLTSNYPGGKITMQERAVYLIGFTRAGFQINKRWSILGGTDLDVPLMEQLRLSAPTGTLTTTAKSIAPGVPVVVCGGRFHVTPEVSVDAAFYLPLGASWHGHGFRAFTIGGSFYAL